MQDQQCPFQSYPSLGQLFFASFMQAAVTEFAKYAAVEMIRELVEPQPPRRKRHYRRKEVM
jgi:hypothetical protein